MVAVTVTVCLLHGKKCPYQQFRYIPRKSQFQIKTCKADFPCNQQYFTSTSALAKIGPCAKAENCPHASEACKLAYNKGAYLRKLRWINCLYGKEANALES